MRFTCILWNTALIFLQKKKKVYELKYFWTFGIKQIYTGLFPSELLKDLNLTICIIKPKAEEKSPKGFPNEFDH